MATNLMRNSWQARYGTVVRRHVEGEKHTGCGSNMYNSLESQDMSVHVDLFQHCILAANCS